MKNIPLKALTLTCVLAGLAAVQSHADIIVSEKFDYTLGSDLVGQGGGLGWSGNWMVNVADRGTTTTADFNFATKAPQGYSKPVGSPAFRQNTNGKGWLEVSRNLSSSISLRPTEQTTYYFSYFWMRVDNPSVTGEASLLSLRTDTGTQLINFGVNGTEKLEIAVQAAAGTAVSAQGTETIRVTNNINTTGQYLIVGKMVLNADGVGSQFYLSAYDSTDVLADEPAVWDIALTANLSNVLVGRITLAAQPYGQTSYWDNITIGTTFEDVGGAIPESSTVSLVMGAGVLGLIAARRLRRRA